MLHQMKKAKHDADYLSLVVSLPIIHGTFVYCNRLLLYLHMILPCLNAIIPFEGNNQDLPIAAYQI